MKHKICLIAGLLVLAVIGGGFFYFQQKNNCSAKGKIIEMSCAFVLSRAIHTAAEMKIADELVSAPLKITELALKLDANAESLYRFMRFLASYGIFAEQANKTFALTRLAQTLLSDHPDTLREWLAGHDGYEKRWQTYGHLDYSIKTGRPAFNELFGAGYFDFISKDAEAAEKFDSGMSNISAGEEEVLVKDYNFSGYKKIVDVGGGVGRLLLQIIKNNPAINCQLFDLPHTVAAAKKFLTEQGVQKSIECDAGSFFDRIPAGADLYVLKRILHDWDDEQCKIILKNCKAAMQPGSKLLILETVVPEGNSRSISKDIDIMMLTLFGGKERTKNEWQELLASVGLKLINVKTTALMLSIIEAE